MGLDEAVIAIGIEFSITTRLPKYEAISWSLTSKIQVPVKYLSTYQQAL